MTVMLMAKAVIKLNEQGYSCSFSSTENCKYTFTVHESHRMFIMFDNFEHGSDDKFAMRVFLLAEHGIRGEMLWQLMQR